ncbi:MAG: alpha/beta fold hydrolase [Alphaproteobacteria bacterium]|nr:alpha/beta fold hydrolase [Alphaproteobacteria bacterium]
MSQITKAMHIDTTIGINQTLEININGQKQWLYIRGKNRNNPVMLYVDGGPGKPSTPWLHLTQLELEKHVTIVHWEQRGSGKSYNPNIPIETMNVAQFIDDGAVVIDWVREKLNADKIYILGHSWGSMLGLLLTQKLPEKITAYIGTGQAVSLPTGHIIVYQKILNQAQQSADAKTIATLERIGQPPYAKHQLKQYNELFWLMVKNGCELHQKSSYSSFYFDIYSTPLYSLSDHMKWFNGNQFSTKYMLDEIQQLDMRNAVPAVQVPVYMLQGRHDYNAPATLAEAYFNQLQAPSKQFIWFENSAHSPNMEQPKKFQHEVINIIQQLEN